MKELSLCGIPFQHQVELPVTYQGALVGIYKADLMLGNKIILEIIGMSSFEHRRVVKSENKSSR